MSSGNVVSRNHPGIRRNAIVQSRPGVMVYSQDVCAKNLGYGDQDNFLLLVEAAHETHKVMVGWFNQTITQWPGYSHDGSGYHARSEKDWTLDWTK